MRYPRVVLPPSGYPVAALPADPLARLDALRGMLQCGLIDREQYVRLGGPIPPHTASDF